MTDQIIMFISQLFNGLKIGSVYALVALGYTMVYGIIRLINFAHGDFIMVGAYVLMLTIPAIVAMGLPAWVAVIPAILVCVAVGVIVEKAAYKPVREKGNSMTALITAIAMSLLLENGSQAIFGADFQTVPDHLPPAVHRVRQAQAAGRHPADHRHRPGHHGGPAAVRQIHQAGQGHARRLRRQGGRRAHGYQRELHHRPDIRHRLRSGRGRLADVLRPPTRRSRL